MNQPNESTSRKVMARLNACRCLAAFALILCSPPLATADTGSAMSRTELTGLFREEIQRAPTRLKWRGERLSEDTLYAAALTGASWELAWGRDPMFFMGWGDCRKAPTLPKSDGASYITLVHRIQGLYEQKQFRQVVQTALNNFTLDQIGCDAFLKEPVGQSFFALGQPEQAFPILAAPFEPPHSGVNAVELNRRFREQALDAARHAGLTREAVAFAWSLVLDPGQDSPAIHTPALAYLERQGVDIDKVLLGVLQAPEKLRGLPAYAYAAADLLAYRAAPKHLPVLLQLANSEDAHLRGRALIGLAIVAYRNAPDEPAGWASTVVIPPLREYGLSISQRKLAEKELREGAMSDKYRVRAAAALGLALVHAEDAETLLQRLLKDRDYVLTLPPGAAANSRQRRIEFPVRIAAAAALARFGIRAQSAPADLEGKALDAARRGGQDVTADRRGLRRDVASRIEVTPLDAYFAAPLELPVAKR